MPTLGLNTFILQYPESTTYMIPSNVNEVSAIFVATTHFRSPSFVRWKIFACKSEGNWEYMGRMTSSGASSTSAKRSFTYSQVTSISS